ncbi:MAG: sigma-70 family RNA polymerase sigma factor [Anaerolineales bacterium]|nr:MAG: sigma-70 family RNA polymerase sigma factor [Anaerolineales bacterium]
MCQPSGTTELAEIGNQAVRGPDFSNVFDEFQRPIYNYLLRLTQNHAQAEDLTQETFIRVHRSLPTFRGDASLTTWIYRIATNVSLDHFRRRATRQAKAALSLEETQSEREWVVDENAPAPEQVASQSEMSDCVQRFIWRLPPSYRTVMVLHDLQGLKNREIADVLDCSLHTVKIRLHRARKKLRAILDAGCDFAHDERNVFVCEPKQTETEEAGG